MVSGHSEQSATVLFDLITAHRITATIYVAVRLGIADLLVGGPRSAADLAGEAQADPSSLRRLLRALVALDICTQPTPTTFALTALGAHLAGDNPRSLKPYALFEGGTLAPAWGGLLRSVQTGKPGWELAGASGRFALLEDDPVAAGIFHAAMASITSAVTPTILATYDFGGIASLMDVGGGSGEMLSQVLCANPSMRGSVFDLPICKAAAQRRFDSAGIADRCEFIAGDFFMAVPSGADAIILKSIIHDWNDERSIAILENCRRALPSQGRLLLIERLMRDPVEATRDDLSNVLNDLNMLRGPGGAERTESEYRALLDATGFGSMRTLSAGRFSILEAMAP